MTKRAVVQGIGHAVPSKVLTNAELEKIVDTNDEWIRQRTGISERRVTEPNETTGTLSIEASKRALSMSGIAPEELNLIILGTVTGDMTTPGAGCLVQHALGAKNAGTFDIGAGCAGFVSSLSVASAMIESGQAQKILVIGADTLTKFVDWTDRGTCILFGDAAAAVVLSAEENTERGILKTALFSDGSGCRLVHIPSQIHQSPENKNSESKIIMAGSEVYRFAVKAIPEACDKVLEMAGVQASEVDLFVPHQANVRIIDAAAARMDFPPEKVFVNAHKYGNTSAGSIPLALSEAVEEGRLKEGMLVLTVGFGAGLVWGANLIRW